MCVALHLTSVIWQQLAELYDPRPKLLHIFRTSVQALALCTNLTADFTASGLPPCVWRCIGVVSEVPDILSPLPPDRVPRHNTPGQHVYALCSQASVGYAHRCVESALAAGQRVSGRPELQALT